MRARTRSSMVVASLLAGCVGGGGAPPDAAPADTGTMAVTDARVDGTMGDGGSLPDDGGAAAPRPIAFAPAAFYRTGQTGAASLDNNGTEVADLDGDGHADVVLVARWQGSTFTVLYGTGTGALETPAQTVRAGLLNSNVILGDYDRDGRIDVAVTGASSLTIVLNDGSRRFHVEDSYLLQESPFQNTGAAADFDADGDLDLALKTPIGIQLMTGDGDGGFDYGSLSTIPGSLVGTIASIDDADLDGDRFRDLVAADAATNRVFALTGDGDGFTVSARQTVPYVATTVRAGDLDHSGLDSVVVLPEASPPDATAAVLANDGTGGLEPPVYYAAGFAVPVGALGDLDGDGDLDLVATNTFSGDIVVLANEGDGTFVPAGSFPTELHAQTPGLGDFDEDGRTDIAVPCACPESFGGLGGVCVAVLLDQT